MGFLADRLAFPGTRGLDLDDPALTEKRREIIQGKAFLRQVYLRFYSELMLVAEDAPHGIQLELGAGAGFFKDVNPRLLTSELLQVAGVDSVLSAQSLPFRDQSLAVLYMLNVFHHLPDPARFLSEASRALVPGGRVVMIEPSASPFARLVYQTLHHEPFDVHAGWKLAGTGPLSDANMAAPWIVFQRDRERFTKEFPYLRITHWKTFMPFSYLLSGGVSMRALAPHFAYPLVDALETITGPVHPWIGMFVLIGLERCAD